MNRSKEFLMELADLLERYNVEIQSDYEIRGYDDVLAYVDFDFQEPPYETISITDVHIDCGDIRRIAGGLEE